MLGFIFCFYMEVSTVYTRIYLDLHILNEHFQNKIRKIRSMVVHTFERSGRGCSFEDVGWVRPLLIESVGVGRRLLIELAASYKPLHCGEKVFIFILFLGWHPIESARIDHRCSFYLAFVLVFAFILLSLGLADLLCAAASLRLAQSYCWDMASHSINIVLSYSWRQVRQILHFVQVVLSEFGLVGLPQSGSSSLWPEMVGGRPREVLFFGADDDGLC